MDDCVELRLVGSPDRAYDAPDEDSRPPVATANRAVPLLWPGLFDYEEAQVRASGDLDLFTAVVPTKLAAERAAVMEQALPPDPPVLRECAHALAFQLRQAPKGHHVVLYPEGVFLTLPSTSARAYLEQLFSLCSIWQRLRGGASWDEVQQDLNRIAPDVIRALKEQEASISGYYLVGSLVDRLNSLDEYLVRQGQEAGDQEPEALAVGEMGLMLGRFGGVWKLMSSSTKQNLKAIWGSGGTVFVVGQAGTVVRMRKGRCTPMVAGTEAHLNGVWGLSPKFMCVVGDGGLLRVHDGTTWHSWSVPTRAPLHTMAGTSMENICVAGQEVTIYRFDGHSWNPMQLPEAGMVSRLCNDDGTLLGVGGTQRGGAIYRLGRDGWTRDGQLPRVEWLESAWKGWGIELGVSAMEGPVLVRTVSGWTYEPLPVEHITSVDAGAEVMAVGRRGGYEVILARVEQRWHVEASLVGLRLSSIWVAGRPKPPPLQPRAEG